MRRAAVSLSIAWRRQSAITEAGMNQFCDKLIAMAGAVVAEGLSVPPRGMTSKGVFPNLPSWVRRFSGCGVRASSFG